MGQLDDESSFVRWIRCRQSKYINTSAAAIQWLIAQWFVDNVNGTCQLSAFISFVLHRVSIVSSREANTGCCFVANASTVANYKCFCVDCLSTTTYRTEYILLVVNPNIFDGTFQAVHTAKDCAQSTEALRYFAASVHWEQKRSVAITTQTL